MYNFQWDATVTREISRAGELGGRRSRDGVLTRARRMAGMNGPRQTAGNARVVAARAFAGGHHARGRARGLAVRPCGHARATPAIPPEETMTQFRRCCLPGKMSEGWWGGAKSTRVRRVVGWETEAMEAVEATDTRGESWKNKYTHVSCTHSNINNSVIIYKSR